MCVYSTGGLVGDTAFHTKIAECFIKHPDYFFGEAPVISVPEKPVKFTRSPPPKPPPGSLALDSNLTVDDDEDIDFEAPTRPLSVNSEDSVNGECVIISTNRATSTNHTTCIINQLSIAVVCPKAVSETAFIFGICMVLL